MIVIKEKKYIRDYIYIIQSKSIISTRQALIAVLLTTKIMKTDTLLEGKTVLDFRKSKLNIQENASLAFHNIFDTWIRPIEISPLMFNYFHWVINYKEECIIHCSNVRKMLGYDDVTLTLEKSQNLVHPNFRNLIKMLTVKVFELFKSEKYRIFSKETHFCIQFPIQHINGSYLLIQQSCTILSIDTDYNPVVVYYRFENLGRYLGFPLVIKPRVCFNAGIYSAELEKVAEAQLSKDINNILLKHVSLTNKQTEVLTLLSQEKSINDIMGELNITVETIKVHNKNILFKAKKNISPMFTNAREVSVFLKESLVA